MPLWSQLNDSCIQIRRDPTAHRHRHALTFNHAKAFLKVTDDILRHQPQPLTITDNRFLLSILGLQLVLARHLLAFQQIIHFAVEPLLGRCVHTQVYQAAFVINWHCRLVLNCSLYVIDVDVVAKHRWRAFVLKLNRRARKADVAGIWQCIAHVFGVAVHHLCVAFADARLQPVLAAVRFVGNHDDIGALAECRERIAAVFGEELLDGREYHTARFSL